MSNVPIEKQAYFLPNQNCVIALDMLASAWLLEIVRVRELRSVESMSNARFRRGGRFLDIGAGPSSGGPGLGGRGRGSCRWGAPTSDGRVRGIALDTLQAGQTNDGCDGGGYRRRFADRGRGRAPSCRQV